MYQEKHFQCCVNEVHVARYVEHRVNIPEEQREKLLSAIGEREAVSIRFRHEDLSGGNDLIVSLNNSSK